MSQYAEVQDIASLTSNLIHMLSEDGMDDAYDDLAARLRPSDDIVELPEIEIPDEITLPVDLFKPGVEEIPTVANVKVNAKTNVKPKVRARRQAKDPASGQRVEVLLKQERVLMAAAAPPDAKKAEKPSALARVDLTATVAEVEQKVNAPRPSTSTSLDLKRRAAAEQERPRRQQEAGRSATTKRRLKR
jgi:hypothetical protein